MALSIEGSEYFGLPKKLLVDNRNLKKENAKKHNIGLMLASTAIFSSCVLVSEDSIYPELGKNEPRLIVENWTK